MRHKNLSAANIRTKPLQIKLSVYSENALQAQCLHDIKGMGISVFPTLNRPRRQDEDEHIRIPLSFRRIRYVLSLIHI